MTLYTGSVVTQMDPKLLHKKISILCTSQSWEGCTLLTLCTRRPARTEHFTSQIHAGTLELTDGIQMPKHKG